jgi:hypothetical protein
LEQWAWLQTKEKEFTEPLDIKRFLKLENFIPNLTVKVDAREVFFGHFLTVFIFSRPNRKDFWNSDDLLKKGLDKTHTMVKSDLEKVENWKSYDQKFAQLFFQFFVVNFKLVFCKNGRITFFAKIIFDVKFNALQNCIEGLCLTKCSFTLKKGDKEGNLTFF